MVDVPVDDRLVVAFEPGDEWRFRIGITHDGDAVTDLGTNTDPWGVACRVLLRNVIAKHLGYPRDELEAAIEAAIRAHEQELREIDGGE